MPGPQAPAPTRVVLRSLDRDTARDVLAGRRRPDWSVGYPTDGDRDVARWIADRPWTAGTDPVFLPYQVLVAESGTVIGGIGCHHPPDSRGSVEIGYGMAAEWRNQGLATEAVGLLVERLRAAAVATVVGRTDPANLASQAVLRHLGFERVRVDRDGLVRWELGLAD